MERSSSLIVDLRSHLSQVRECVVSLRLVKAVRHSVTERNVPMSLALKCWHFTNLTEHLHIELGRKRKLFVCNGIGRAKALRPLNLKCVSPNSDSDKQGVKETALKPNTCPRMNQPKGTAIVHLMK